MNNISTEIFDIAKFLYENEECEVIVNRYGQVEDVSFDNVDYEDFCAYAMDCSEEDFEKAEIYLKSLLMNDVKFYSEYSRYLELSDNRTLNDITVPEGVNFDIEEYSVVRDMAVNQLSQEIHTEVYMLGRSGRHICVDNTFNNLVHYSEYKQKQKEWEAWLINVVNQELTNTPKDDLSESLNAGEYVAKCLNCGADVVYTKRDVCEDIDGDYIECPNCKATFGVECNNDKCKVSDEKAQKFADGLNEDPDCEAWVKSLKENRMTEGLRQDTINYKLDGFKGVTISVVDKKNGINTEEYIKFDSMEFGIDEYEFENSMVDSIKDILTNIYESSDAYYDDVFTSDEIDEIAKHITQDVLQLYDDLPEEKIDRNNRYGIVAQGLNKKEEAIDWVGDTKVNDNGTVTIDGRERTADSIKAEIKSLRDELKRSKEAYSNKQIRKHQRSYDKFRYTRQIEKLKAFLDLLKNNSKDLEEDCTQASGVDAGKVTLFGSDEKDKKEEARLTDYLGILQIRDILQKNPDTANKEFAIKDNMIVEVGTGDDVANYKAIKNDDGEWELLKENLTTTSGEYNTEEYNKICDKLKQAYKDAWDNKISYAELENIKRQSGLSNAELTSIQYTASRETDKKEELITEDINTAQTITEKLNTGVLPIVDTDMYSLNDVLPESATLEELDDIVKEVATPFIKDTIQKVLPSVEIKATGVYHPKQYNFSGDELEFDLTVSSEEYEALKEKVLADNKFNKFLRDEYSSKSGIISTMPDSIEEFNVADSWKQLVQVIMFALRNEALTDVNEAYLNDFLDAVSNEFPSDDIVEEDKGLGLSESELKENLNK